MEREVASRNRKGVYFVEYFILLQSLSFREVLRL